MESFEERLSAGGHANSLGRSGEVLRIVRGNHARIDELFDCIFADDAWVRMRAIDTFEKLVKENPSLARPYLDRIFTQLTKSDQASIQWHVAQLFAEVKLNETQYRQAIGWLKQRIATVDVDWIVSVNVMKTLLYFHKEGRVSAKEITPLFEVQLAHSSKSVRKKAAAFLEYLSQ